MLNRKELTEKKLTQIKKNKKNKIVLCHGVFDLFHVGHLDHLKQAKLHGDILIVSLTEDKYVNKAPGRPFFNIEQRKELISSIEHVDYVITSDHETAENSIKKNKAQYLF